MTFALEPTQETFPGFVLPQDIPLGKPVDIRNLKLIKYLCDDLTKTLKEIGGLGLSAVQKGYKYQLFVAEIEDKLICFVNCDYTPFGDIIFHTEGCLSIGKGKELYSVRRNTMVTLTGYIWDGRQVISINKYYGKKIKRFTDLDSFVLQHEIQHQQGCLISHVGRRAYK